MRRLPVLLLLVLPFVLPAAAPAAPGLQRIVQDDATFVFGREPLRTRALDDLRVLGTDVVRVNLRWDLLAPRRPADETDSRSYPGDWGPYDRLVADARTRGLEVLMTVSTPAPRWAARDLAGRYRGVVDPDVRAFGRFALAAAGRYGATVRRWSLVNEPNQPRFLGPQSRSGRLHAPAHYRALVRAGLEGLRGGGVDPRDVLLGELLATGRRHRGPTVPIGPVPFLRELLCLDARDRPLRGAALRGHEGCTATFTPLEAGGIAVHLYYLGGGPRLRPIRAGDLTPVALGELRRTLAAARRARRLTGTAIWDTEGGVQTNPPDRLSGVPLATQARFLNESEAALWRTPGVRSFAQYLLRDDLEPKSFQTGLWFRDGTRKPAFAAYRLPVEVRAVSRTRVALWARAPTGSAARILVTGPGGLRRTVPRSALAADRTFTLRLPRRDGAYRVRVGAAVSRAARAR